MFIGVRAEISLSLRRVRGLISFSFQTMNRTSYLMHILPLLHSGSSTTLMSNLSRDCSTTPHPTCGCRKKTKIGTIPSSSQSETRLPRTGVVGNKKRVQP